MKLFFPVLFFFSQVASAQNLPSFLSGKNINATFSIIAFDSAAQEWGVAVATNNIYVGNSTIYVQPGLGAFSVIAETEPRYAIQGFEQLKQGSSIQQAIELTMKTDSERYLRQVSGIDRHGNTFAFTGASWKYEPGFAGIRKGKFCLVMGNQLADSVLANMVTEFERHGSTLAERLLAALLAGQRAGGQIQGKQSSALLVKGTNNEWFNNVDLRVDNAKDPFNDLKRLLNYHYGRIRLNQAMYAINMGNLSLGRSRLHEAEKMIIGWNGMQAKLAKAWLLLSDTVKAVKIIRAALKENPQWKENMPAFYILRNQPDMKGLIDEKKFKEKNWIEAVSFTGQLNRTKETIVLCKKALQHFPGSSYLHFQMAQLLLSENKTKEAKQDLQLAIQLDPGNEEAEGLLRDTN